MSDAPLAAAAPPRLTRADQVRAGLILLTLALFTTASLVHYAMGVMALAGIVEFVRERHWHHPLARTLGMLFALLWLPMLIAWPTAVSREHTAGVVLPYLHLLPAAWFVARACLNPAVRRVVSQGAVILAAFIAIDAFVQLFWHQDLFGYPYKRGVLKGVFHPKQRLGLFLAVFAPLYGATVLGWCRRHVALVVLLVPMAVVLLMSLKRSAWIMLVFGLLFFALAWVRRPGVRRLALSRVLVVALLLALAAGATLSNASLRARLAETSGVFSTDLARFDKASAYRLTLWRTGLRIFADHWLTGIGPRGFRHAYADYAPKDDFWLKRTGQGQTHPHQVLLEIAIETGVIGLVAFLVFYGRLLARLLRAPRDTPVPAWLVGAAVAWLPLNAHLAFYGSYWSSLAWLVLAIGLAETATAREAA